MAKIIGNTVGIPNPQPDWNQTDEIKADYIKNKPFGEELILIDSIAWREDYEDYFQKPLGLVIGDTYQVVLTRENGEKVMFYHVAQEDNYHYGDSVLVGDNYRITDLKEVGIAACQMDGGGYTSLSVQKVVTNKLNNTYLDLEGIGKAVDTNGGTTNIENATIKGYNCGGIVKAFQPQSAELLVCPYDAETGSYSVGDVITAEYDTSDPNLRTKATFTYQGNIYEIDNVGDFVEIREKLGLKNNDDIGLRFYFNSIEGIEVGMTYNLCYPVGTKFRYGKVLFVEENSIIIDNETTGIHRYLEVFNGLPSTSTSFYGNVVINGGLIGEVDITDSEGVSLHSEGIETYASIGGHSDGCKTKALSFIAHAGGKETEVSGFGAFGHGVLLDIAAHHGFGGGELVTILPFATASTGFGSNIYIAGERAFGAGFRINVLGDFGFGLGQGHEITGKYAGALNRNNKAKGLGALATGVETEANGDFTFTTGYHSIAEKAYQSVFGKYNEKDVDGKYLFIIGNGFDDDNRLNIFTVDGKGNAWFKGSIDALDGNFRGNITSQGNITSEGKIFAEGNKKVLVEGEASTKLKDGEGARSVKFGSGTKAPGNDSFAGGNNSEANAMRTITVGQWTVAESPAQATFGKFNTRDFDEKYVFMLGNGRSDSLRSDAVVVDWQGNTYLAGNVYVGHNNIAKVGGTVQAYVASAPSVKVANSPFIAVGKIIEINDEYRTITEVSISGVTATLTLDSAFTVAPTTSDVYLIYNSAAERNKDKSEMLATRKYVVSEGTKLKANIEATIPKTTSALTNDSEFVSKDYVANAINALSPTIITSVNNNTLVLANNQEARLGMLSTLILSIPDNITALYESEFSFNSGTTATTLTYPATPVTWRGDDCDEEGLFAPEANTNYEVSIKCMGFNADGTPIVLARVGAY